MYCLKDVEITHTTNDFYELMKQIKVSIDYTIQEVVKKSAMNTYKKYLVYWNEVTYDAEIYTHFELYDSDEKLHNGVLIDLDEVRKLIKDGVL